MPAPEAIAVLSDVNEAAYPIFEDGGFKPVRVVRGLKGQDLAEQVHDIGAVGIALRSNPELDADFFKLNPQLLIVGNFCVQGKVNLEAIDEAGVTHFNSPTGNAPAVAGYDIAQVLNLSRGIPFQHYLMTKPHMPVGEGRWAKPASGDAFDHEGERFGLIGMGNVGPFVAKRAAQIGLEVVFSDLNPEIESEHATRLSSNDEVLETSRFVAVHLPLTDATRGLIGERAFSIMRPDAFIINAARGPVVDIIAYRKALLAGEIAGGAFDVHDEDGKKEPGKVGDAFESILRGLPRTILTSHTAGTTVNAARGIAVEVATKMVERGRYGNTQGALNVPNHDVGPLPPGAARLLFFHDNIPGAAADVGDILRREGINVANETVGQIDDQDIPGRLALGKFEIRQSEISDETVKEIEGVPAARRVDVLRG